MTFEVLQNMSQVYTARRKLKNRDLSFATPEWKQWMQRYRLWPGFRIGDGLKSWDVLKTVDFVEAKISKDAAVLDIGAFASEVPLILHQLGYRNVCGVDLNPRLLQMPFASNVDYRISDFMSTPYPDASFDTITSISVIEHGFEAENLAREVGRLLKPGGFFIASMDYWPEKIATEGIKLFDMSWTIFSKEDIQSFIETASKYGLHPHGELRFDGNKREISCLGRDYTFGWLILEKC
jgi:SAM-dependent methyltransferase